MQRTVENVHLIRPGGSGDRVFTAHNAAYVPLGIGGQDGSKSNLVIPNPHTDIDQLTGIDRAKPIILFVKHVNPRFINSPQEIVQFNEELRIKGYPVAPTMRYFYQDGTCFLAQTDMTNGEEYRIWGG